MKDLLSSIHIDASSRRGKKYSERYLHTNQEIIVAAAEIGLDYVQLWNRMIIGNKTTIFDNISDVATESRRKIIIHKLKDLLQKHKNIYNNKLNEAKDISKILFKAAMLNVS